MKLFSVFLAIARGVSVPSSDGISPRGSQEDIMTDVLSDCNSNSWDTDRCALEMTEKLYSRLRNQYSCMTTDRSYSSFYVASLAVYHAFDPNYYANCDKKSNLSIDKESFESQVRKIFKIFK